MERKAPEVVHLVSVPSPNGTNIGQNFFKVSPGWSQDDLMALDAAPDDDDDRAAPYRDPENTNAGEADAEDEDDEDTDGLLFAHLRSRGITNETLGRIRSEINGSGKQAPAQFGASDDDKPDDNPYGGQPLRGGKMTALKQAQDEVLMAMDGERGHAVERFKKLAKRYPATARKLYATQAKGSASFAKRWKNAARIGVV